MKRKQVSTFDINYTVIETTVSSATYVEFMPHLWIVPPKNKMLVHKERDVVKFWFPLRLPQQTKDNYRKYVKQAKFNCIAPERNDKWELKEGRILKMGLGSFEEAVEAEKFYSDYFSTTEAENQDKAPVIPAPVPKKVVRKKKKSDLKPKNDSESEEEEEQQQQGDAISNYNNSFQASNDILSMFTLDQNNAILSVNFNQLLNDGVFESGNGSLLQPELGIEDTLSSEGNLPIRSNEKFATNNVPPTIDQTSSELVQKVIFVEDQQITATDDTVDQQSNCPQTNCCKCHQKVLNKIDYFQKKWSKEMSLFHQENRGNRQILLQVLNLLSPTEGQAEDIREDQMEESRGLPAQPQLDMAELDRFNAKYKATFPISSSDFIVDFNKSLKDEQTFADNLFAKLSQIKGDDEIKTVRKILKELCDVRCLKDFTWLGTKKMKSFQDLHLIIEMISKLLKENYPECDAIDIISKVVKQRTKSANEAFVVILAAEEAAAATAGQARKLSKDDTAAIRENVIAEHHSTVIQNENTASIASTEPNEGDKAATIRLPVQPKKSIDISTANRENEIVKNNSQHTVGESMIL